MRTIHYAIIGAVSLALAACGQQDDTLDDNVDANFEADQLNALADNAAMEAEAEALGNQAQQLEATNAPETANEADITTEPSEVEDDVQGM